jgi:hypothetical protein
MSAIRLFSLVSILALTGGMTLMNSNTFDSVLAVETKCDAKNQTVFGCPLGSDNEGPFATASAKTVIGEMEDHNIGIDAIDRTSGISVIISENKGSANPNIESQIPSIISAIPFP